LRFFEQAIDKDPSYALAHAGVADSYAVGGGSYLGLTSQEARPRGRAAALRAIALDDSLAEAHTTLADILFYHDRDYEGAEREFIRAIKLNPNYATAPQWYSELLSALGRHEEAIAASRRGQMIDPLSPIITLSVGSAYFAAGRLDEALRQVDKAVELDPNFVQAYVYYRDIHETAERYDEAITAWKRALTLSGDVDRATLVETTYRVGGYEAVLRKSAEIGDRETPRNFGRLAVMYTRLGQYDLAIARLQEALEVNDGTVTWIHANQAFEPLHSDPRFRKLVEQAGLAD
jgi:serine/threonine-protein kinase